MSDYAKVYIVDDDESLRRSLEWLVSSVDLRAESFATAREFLDSYTADSPGCLVLDVRLPGMSGLELQEKLNEREIELPVIVVTGHADVPMAVRAIRGGAMDFFEKPFNGQELLERIQQAIEADEQARRRRERKRKMQERIDKLTSREREVLKLIVDGFPNKKIASVLSLSEKTVEAHRSRIMRKTQAGNVAELVRIGFDGMSENELVQTS